MGQIVMNFGGIPAATSARKVSTNTAQTLLAVAAYTASDAIIGAIITCEVNDIKFAMGGTEPTSHTTGAGVGHVLHAGQSLHLSSGAAVRTFQFVSSVISAAGYLVVTPLLERS